VLDNILGKSRVLVVATRRWKKEKKKNEKKKKTKIDKME